MNNSDDEDETFEMMEEAGGGNHRHHQFDEDEDGYMSGDEFFDIQPAVAPAHAVAVGQVEEEIEIDVENGDPSRKRKTRDGEDDDDEEGDGLGIHMVISDEERRWALLLREALAEDEETRGTVVLTDMELVQYAIVERGNIPKCLDRIKRMQAFITKYQIRSTVEHGMQCIKDFMEQQPGMSLNIDQCSRHKHFVHVIDFAKFNPRKVNLPNDWRVFMSGIHYFMSALNPTLSAVRNGVLGIMECDGMGWHNFCMDFERQLWYEFAGCYPSKFHELSWVRTPLVANVFYSLLKPIMSEEVRKVVYLGVKFDESFDGRLDGLFLQPTVEIANQRQLMTVESFLETRYHNEKHFRL